MTDTPKVEQVNIVLRLGSSDWAYGFYLVEGDVVTMTDKDGTPLVDPYGKTYTATLDGETPRTVAARMVRRIESSRLRRSDFNRPLVYPKIGIA